MYRVQQKAKKQQCTVIFIICFDVCKCFCLLTHTYILYIGCQHGNNGGSILHLSVSAALYIP